MAGEYNYSSLNDETKEWKDITINGVECVISTCYTNNSWTISLSNLIEIWTETITTEIALARCQSLNMLLDLDSLSIKETIDKLLNDVPKHATHKSLNEIKLETFIDGIAFKFSVNFTKGTPLQFFNEIVKPLCQSSTELKRRYEVLIDLVEKKDEELSEYKLSGALLTRKNIETRPYSKEIFKAKMSDNNSKPDDCTNAFRLMMDLRNETKSFESELKNNGRSLTGESSNPNPVNPELRMKLENLDSSETTPNVEIHNVDETESGIKTEIETNNDSFMENESIGSRLRNVEENEMVKTGSSVEESKAVSTIEKISKKRSNTKNMPLPLVKKEQSGKKSKSLKNTRNIYDCIL